MGAEDIAAISYMRQNEVFADAFNYFVYGGRQIIRPENLEEMDTREMTLPYGGKKSKGKSVQKTRDVMKIVMAMTDRHSAYLLLAIEHQSDIHYAMPVRNMLYDALQYARQVEDAARSHRLSGDYKGADSAEFLSGFMRRDRLLPVLTLVIYFGAEEWDGPISIHEMFGEMDTEVLSLVPDYRMNLLAPALIPDNDFGRFQSSLKEVLFFIKYSNDADRLQELIRQDPGFQHLGRNEINVLNTCVNANITIGKGEKKMDTCKAIQTMIDRAVEKATREADEKATVQAEQQRISTLCDNIRRLMEKLGWSAAEAMDVLCVSESDRKVLERELS